jgi:diaminohydroxyphosphoribosylaminopyrimidine deaminase/5-amino-6-(5-phosphoribosylamino)uracil reductase
MIPHPVFMKRCLQLAEKGLGRTRSNPLVGAVVVHNSRIIGEGYHRDYGGPHAEVHAIESVKQKDLLKNSILYVNLEPCSHHGKTPPCTDLIISSRIPSVVIGSTDPSAKVRGKGIVHLRNSGCQVEEGILQKESVFLNRRFFTFHSRERPYIILKWAESADGFIDVFRKPEDPIGPNWISGPLERILVHQWRSQEEALLVGTNTVLVDDPGLDVRLWPGRSPIRLVIDRDLKIGMDHKIFSGPQKTILFNNKAHETGERLQLVRVDFSRSIWPEIMKFLFESDILSIMVEGGANTLKSLILEGLWDEARVFKGTKLFHEGIPAPKITSVDPSRYPTWRTHLEIYHNAPSEPPYTPSGQIIP